MSAGSEAEAIYGYEDERGELLFEALRLPGKRFAQRRPDGNGGWVWNLNGTRRVLFHLPDVLIHLESNRADPIYVVEGEKDVLAIEGAGGTGTCNPQGAGKWRDEFSESLRGARRVVVVADQDEPGREHARQVRDSLSAVGIVAEVVQPLEGKDAADHLAAGFALEMLEPTELGEQTSDQAAGASWQTINLASLPARPATKPTLGGLGFLYPSQRHVFSGPPESAKTIAAYAGALAIIRQGGRVVLIDFEMGRWEARDRFRELGATDPELERLHYVEPEEPATEDALARLAASAPDLVIVDAAAGAYGLEGLDDNKRADVERLAALYIRGFHRREIATLVLDHVVKKADERGRFAIGSERKMGGADVHLGFEIVTQISRGGHGLYKISTHKDRSGWLPRPRTAEFELRSDPVTHAITWTFRDASAQGDEPESWRPTTLMERVSRYLEQQSEQVSRGAIEEAVRGKTDWIRKAVDFLVADGYVSESKGARDARLFVSIRPFREADLAPTSPLPDEDDLAPTPPLAEPHNQADSATSPHLAPTSPLAPESTSPQIALSPQGERIGRGEVVGESEAGPA